MPLDTVRVQLLKSLQGLAVVSVLAGAEVSQVGDVGIGIAHGHGVGHDPVQLLDLALVVVLLGQAEEVEERICLEFDDEFAPLVELERPVIRCLTVLRLARDVRGHELGYLTHGKRAVRVSIRRFLFSGATLHRPAEALQQPSRE